MSSNVEFMQCVECEEKCKFPSEINLYHSPDAGESPPNYRSWNWFAVLTDHVWCFACDGASYAERVPTMKEMTVAAAYRRDPNRKHIENIEDELLDISNEHFTFLATWLTRREAHPKCLTCGSDNVSKLQIAIDRVANMNHAYCGGAFSFIRYYVNSYGPRTIRWLDVHGNVLGIQEDRF